MSGTISKKTHRGLSEANLHVMDGERADVLAPFRGAPRKALSCSRPGPGAHRTPRGV